VVDASLPFFYSNILSLGLTFLTPASEGKPAGGTFDGSVREKKYRQGES